MTRFALALALSAALLLVACGCGGSPSTGTDEALEARVKEYFEAFRDDAPQASYEFYRSSCRDQYSLSDYTSTIDATKALFEDFLNIQFEDVELTAVEVVSNDGMDATVRLTLEVEGEPLGDGADEPEPWKFEDGEWYAANCSNMSLDAAD